MYSMDLKVRISVSLRRKIQQPTTEIQVKTQLDVRESCQAAPLNISIVHRSAYQSNFSIASALHATGRLVTSFHRIGSQPSGVPRSAAWITVSSSGH